MSQKTTQGTHVLVLCIRVSIECPKNDTGTRVLLMLCAEMTHAQSNTYVSTAQALGNMCAPCAEFQDIRLTRNCMWFQHILFWSAALTTILHLRTLFARFGIPESLASDNDLQFTAAEFQLFCKQNGIRHIQMVPYHPASNRLAERAVQTFNKGIQKFTTGTIGDRITCFLMQYRVTSHTTTELLFGRRMRLDAIRPNLERQVETKLLGQKENYDKRAQERAFAKTDRVYVQNFGRGETWLASDIVQTLGPVSFQVRLTDDRLVRRHQTRLGSKLILLYLTLR